MKPAYNRTVGCRIIPVARTFRFIQVLKFWLLMTPDHWDFRSFVLKTGCRYVQVPFKTCCTVLQFFFLIISFLVKYRSTVHALFHMARHCSVVHFHITNVKCSTMTVKIRRKWKERMKCIQGGINSPAQSSAINLSFTTVGSFTSHHFNFQTLQ